MNNHLIELERKAIKFIRNAEKLALRMNENGFHVAFSGGKDSQVLLALVEMSGVKHHAEMQVTTVDSPNLMKFVRTNYPQVRLNLPKLNMRQLILKKKMLPTRQARFCCAFLKEQAGGGNLHLSGHPQSRIKPTGKAAQCRSIGATYRL
jgi:phosphoadenosine phosphosulfate reductase